MSRPLYCLLFVLCHAVLAPAYAGDNHVKITTKAGIRHFTVEVVDTWLSKAKGLMHRQQLGENAGMLFLYSPPEATAFWMKNTLIPLDIIFIDDTDKIIKIHAEAIPHDLTPIKSGQPVKAVLEIEGGGAAATGILVGDKVQLIRSN